LEDDTPEVWCDPESHRVIRQDAAGKLLWEVKLDGELESGRAVWDQDRVYLAHNDGVTALAFATGKVLWHSDGSSQCCMLISGDLLVAAGYDVTSTWVYARSVTDGAKVFKTAFPGKDFEPISLQPAADLFAVVSFEPIGRPGESFLLDRWGRVRHRFDRQVVAGLRQGDFRLILTSTALVRVTIDDQVRWKLRLDNWFKGDGGLVELPGGDVLVFRYSRYSDTGVEVLRVNASSGDKVWDVDCPGLGVTHSKYGHRASVGVRGGKVYVTSRGSSGTFVESLDPETGLQLKRTVKMRW
jgi:outer membrane protein assembly factor BamB